MEFYDSSCRPLLIVPYCYCVKGSVVLLVNAAVLLTVV